MTRRLGRTWGTVLAAWCCLVACSLTSDLDELDENSGADASTTQCQTGVDCSGCAGCDAWCACLSSGSVAACVAQCLDGGGATSGASGTAGNGGSGAADASAGGIGGSGAADASAGGIGGSAGSGTAGTAGAAGSDGSVAVPFDPGVVHCASTNDCVLLTGHCCVSTQGVATCEGLAVGCGGLSADIRCDGPEDCDPGEVCCGEVSFGQYVTLAECRTACDSPDVIACGGKQTACSPGRSCVPYVVLNVTTPYTICK